MTLNDLFAEQAIKLGFVQPPAPPTPRSTSRTVANIEDVRARKWLEAKVAGKVAELSVMGPRSGRNAALNASAYDLGHYVPKWLDEQDVTDALLDACRTNKLLSEDGETQCLKSIQSGLSAGGADPKDPPASGEDDLSSMVVGGAAMLPRAAVKGDPAPEVEGSDAEESDEERAARVHAYRVDAELVQLRARHDAKTLHAAELAAAHFRAPAYTRTLTDELLIPDEPVTYAIDELLPTGGNALLAAQFKAGKTTLVNNLLRAYADQTAFLGRYSVPAGTGRIGIFNYELSPSQYRRWLRDLGIVNTDRVAVLNLRGYRLPLTAASVEDWIVGWLKEQDVTFWIADPFARAATGTDENSNTEVGVWLDTFDVIKERAGVSEAILPTHTGRAEQEAGKERARGATRLDDWADVRWLLTKDEDGNSFFRATGRDVSVEEELLTYSDTDRRLTIGGGDRRWVRGRELAQRVLDYINAEPACTTRAIGIAVKGNKEQIDAARMDLIRRHKVRVEDGLRGAQHHYANEVEA